MVFLSIIIPTYNEEKNIGDCIESLKKQTYKNFEIIIVDDGSIDRTREIVKDYKVKLIKQEHKGPGAARNLGAKNSKGKVLIFVDADMTFDKNYLKNLIKPITSKKYIGTEDGLQIASNKDNIWSRCWGAYFKDYSTANKGYVFRAILKKEFLKMGGFDPKYGYADDLTFYYKYGVTSKRVLGAICYHKNPSTLKEVYKQSRWIGASLQNKLFTVPIVKHLIPFIAFLLFPIAIPLLALIKSYKNENFRIIFPWMLIFITVRYFGTLEGFFMRVYLNKNVR